MWQLHHAQISQFVTVNQLPKYVEFLNPQQVGLVRSWTQLTDTPPFSWSSPSQVDLEGHDRFRPALSRSVWSPNFILFPILGAGVWSNEPQVLITLSHFSVSGYCVMMVISSHLMLSATQRARGQRLMSLDASSCPCPPQPPQHYSTFPHTARLVIPPIL